MYVRPAIIALLFTMAVQAQPVRRALLIGIDDYTASTLPQTTTTNHERGWPDLKGAVNDVELLEEMLVLSYGFERKNIVTLKNQQATRDAILQAMERHLVQPASEGDIVFYYYAGHGGQVPNPESDELDRLDESIVPADSRRGAKDIRDKELRSLFNRILDRGAHLTLLLDHCHSGSSFRGLPAGARRRGIGPAPRISDATHYGPRPEERGALVLVSAQDRDVAEETYGEDGKSHGAFTWAWIRAMRDAAAGEPAQETFLRARARLRVDKPHQAPAMLGSIAARRRPFLGSRVDRRGDRMVVAVERVEPDGRVVLQGGWAHGLAIGAELRAIGTPGPAVRVTSILGLGRSIASGGAGVRSGMLLEVVRPAASEAKAWRSLQSAPANDAPYRLALRHERTGAVVEQGPVIGGQTYSVVLRRRRASERDVAPRYYYVFVIDSDGRSYLVWPKSGSVEHRFPIGETAPSEIAIGAASAFDVMRPYGADTYFLLSTDEPLPDPSILEWHGVRAVRKLAASRWSIERVTIESVAPARRRASGGRAAARRR